MTPCKVMSMQSHLQTMQSHQTCIKDRTKIEISEFESQLMNNGQIHNLARSYCCTN